MSGNNEENKVEGSDKSQQDMSIFEERLSKIEEAIVDIETIREDLEEIKVAIGDLRDSESPDYAEKASELIRQIEEMGDKFITKDSIDISTGVITELKESTGYTGSIQDSAARILMEIAVKSGPAGRVVIDDSPEMINRAATMAINLHNAIAERSATIK